MEKALCLSGKISVPAVMLEKGGHYSKRGADAVHAIGQVDGISPHFLHIPQHLAAFAHAPPAFGIFLGGESDDHRIIRTCLCSDFAENFAEETHPVVIGPAVFINPVVAVRRQEFMDQIPVGCVDLHSVKTGLPGI